MELLQFVFLRFLIQIIKTFKDNFEINQSSELKTTVIG